MTALITHSLIASTGLAIGYSIMHISITIHQLILFIIPILLLCVTCIGCMYHQETYMQIILTHYLIIGTGINFFIIGLYVRSQR